MSASVDLPRPSKEFSNSEWEAREPSGLRISIVQCPWTLIPSLGPPAGFSSVMATVARDRSSVRKYVCSKAIPHLLLLELAVFRFEPPHKTRNRGGKGVRWDEVRRRRSGRALHEQTPKPLVIRFAEG